MRKRGLKNALRIAIVGAAMFSASQLSAASLLTSSAGYTGPTLDLSAFDAFYVFTQGPIALPGGITYSSTSAGSVIGKGGYGLADNGGSENALIVGTNSGSDVVTFTFDTAVATFGGGMNYALSGSGPFGNNPVIAAYDSFDALIASYDLLTLAPINTPGGLDAFEFRGINGDGTLIKSFTISGSFAIIQGNLGNAVPEPATWAMMLLGFGFVGGAMRAAKRRQNLSVPLA